MKITREIKTALLVILSILLFYWGFSFLKGSDLFSSHKVYYVEYENVDGLANSAPITINGIVIGRVNSITFDNQKSWTPIVELHINNAYSFSKSSVAKIYEPSFIGGKQIMIIPGATSDPVLLSGDYIEGAVELGMTSKLTAQLEPLQVKISAVLDGADSLLVNINQVMDESTKKNLKQSIAGLNETLASFSKVSKNLDEMLVNNKTSINKTMSNISEASANFVAISDSLEKANLAGTIKNLEQTLAQAELLLKDMNEGKGTIGKFMKDEKLYNNLESATKEMEQLLGDMKRNPKRYVHFSLFGKKPDQFEAKEEKTN